MYISMKLINCLTTLIIVVSQVAYGVPSLRIALGDSVAPKEFPWNVKLAIRRIFCGASLVKLSPTDTESDIVLTAAHCFGTCSNNGEPCCYENSINTTFVLHSTIDRDKGVKVMVKRVHAYADKVHYDGYHDMALVQLAEKVKFTDAVRGIPIPEKDGAMPSKDDKCVLAGWGSTEDDKYLTMMRKVEFKISDPCEGLESDVVNFCGRSVNNRTPACPGDSGSPAVCQSANGVWTQYGITFGGRDKIDPNSTACGNHQTTVFTRVSSYLKWIRDVIKNGHLMKCPLQEKF